MSSPTRSHAPLCISRGFVRYGPTTDCLSVKKSKSTFTSRKPYTANTELPSMHISSSAMPEFAIILRYFSSSALNFGRFLHKFVLSRCIEFWLNSRRDNSTVCACVSLMCMTYGFGYTPKNLRTSYLHSRVILQELASKTNTRTGLSFLFSGK